jgi:CO dehydrogenase maturation factor
MTAPGLSSKLCSLGEFFEIMKIAITGKGGVGKTTLASILAHLYAEEGRNVIAVDADPDANLASALGIPREEAEKIQPISAMAELIQERTGAKRGSIGGTFTLNPKVDDLPEGVGYRMNRILLLTMGKVKDAASGCYCPENVLLRSLLRHLIVKRSEVVIVDMEAGIEHLTRGTAESVDAFIVVVEPGQRSIQTAKTVFSLARGLGVNRVYVVANKVRGQGDIEFIERHIGGQHVIGSITFSHAIMEADMMGSSPCSYSGETVSEVRHIKNAIEESLGNMV